MMADKVNLKIFTYLPLGSYAGWMKQTISLLISLKPNKINFNWHTMSCGSGKCLPQIESLTVSLINNKIFNLSMLNRKIKEVLFIILSIKLHFKDITKNDRVYSPNSYFPICLVLIIYNIIGVPVILRVCHSELSGKSIASKLRKALALRFAYKIIVLNKATYNNLNGNKYKSVIYMPNGVDVRKFRPVNQDKKNKLRSINNISEKEIVILFVGSIVLRKGVDVLVKSFCKLYDKYKNIRLLLVGPIDSGSDGVQDNYITNLYNYINEAGLKNNINFAGKHDSIKDYYSVADIFVLPSFSEGMPSVLLEGMASGLACVASNISGVNDVIKNNYDGILVKPGSERALTKAIEGLLLDNNKIHQIGKRARSKICDHYSLSIVANRYYKEFH